MDYPVTTIGEMAPCCDECAKKGAPQMGALEDVAIIVNPIGWAASKIFGAAVDKATSGPVAPVRPTGLDALAKSLGVRPIALAIGITGYTGLGKYEGAAKAVSAAAVLGAIGLYAYRRAKKTRKGKRG